MAGAILSPDQIARINAAFPALVGHVRSLLTGDHTAVGLMEVHSMVESLNTDYLARLFTDLSYLSPVQKKALVRAALYQLIASEPALFVGTPGLVAPVARPVANEAAAPKTYSPPPFKINVNPSTAFHGQAPADVSVASPKVTSTHTSKVAEMSKAGDKQQAESLVKREAAVLKIQESVRPIEIAPAPAAPIDIPTDPA